MSLFHKTIGVFNLFLIGLFIYYWNPFSALVLLTTGSIFPIVLLITISFIIIYGTIKALRHIFSQKENKIQLPAIERVLMFAPLVNIVLMIVSLLIIYVS